MYKYIDLYSFDNIINNDTYTRNIGSNKKFSAYFDFMIFFFQVIR